ncbi:MAG: glutamate--tRNA ligase [Mycoplasmataceae bacterium]|nr:glutamate--tRNA ligase [Mycoplasmataceae bacterium]
MNKVRLRYAPSPTGMLHIGGARTALFNFLYAKSLKGDFIVRIDDTDTERNVTGGESSQLSLLRWLGIKIDETVDTNSSYGPYRQSEKIDLYRKYISELIDSGKAYKCFHTNDEIDAERQLQKKEGKWNFMHQCSHKDLSKSEIKSLEDKMEFSVRIKTKNEGNVSWDDMIRGKITVNCDEIGDWVALRTNGIPTYNFTSVIDDYLMKITHVMRGEEHIANTPKQILLQEDLGFSIPVYSHLTLIVGEDKKKLSKRNESIVQFISQYKDLGYLPEAIINYLSLLGWSPKGHEEVFTIDELIELFNKEGFSKSSAIFDPKKMEWYNNQYINKLSDEDYFTFIEKYAPRELVKKYDLNLRKRIYNLFKPQIRSGIEIKDLTKIFIDFNKYENYTQDFNTVREVLINEIEKSSSFDKETISGIFNILKKEHKIAPKLIFMPTRLMVTGMEHGPDLKESMEILGMKEVIRRLKMYDK